MNGKLEQARAVYREVLPRMPTTRPQGITARTRIASLMIRSGKADEASKLIDEVLAKNPSDADALVMRAQIAIQRGDTNAAVTDLRTALRDQPTNLLLIVQLAQAYIQLRQHCARRADAALRRCRRTRATCRRGSRWRSSWSTRASPRRRGPCSSSSSRTNRTTCEALEGYAKLSCCWRTTRPALQAGQHASRRCSRNRRPASTSRGVAQQAQKNNDEARKSFEEALAARSRSRSIRWSRSRSSTSPRVGEAEALARLDERIIAGARTTRGCTTCAATC